MTLVNLGSFGVFVQEPSFCGWKGIPWCGKMRTLAQFLGVQALLFIPVLGPNHPNLSNPEANAGDGHP
ncbi:hypothetical protein HPP92_028832 [Vanilla planifolia]|uniref:Uncharacterized protein n=1 Tax=Vanilla planifolia TaxID=51239 RepID=A0A835U1Y2_VANPL|nr:hypothetical protein HPP92_028832 [Vanilla planifolia]KAG0446468.1 hypothetical protein HPP92_028821 [Vanilla planifolia]